jgi:folylpolyglutamate synthase/dihydropteroate synthase
MSTAREELHRVIDKLQDKDVESLLHLLKKIISNYNYSTETEKEELTEEAILEIKKAKTEIERGEYVDFDDLKKEYGI